MFLIYMMESLGVRDNRFYKGSTSLTESYPSKTFDWTIILSSGEVKLPCDKIRDATCQAVLITLPQQVTVTIGY